MSGALSIPFALLAFFNVFSQRLLFAVLAYASLWLLVLSQDRRIKSLTSRAKHPAMAAYDDLDELVKQGEQMLQRLMLERLKKNEPPTPTESEFEKWNEELITVSESCATIDERNRLRASSPLEVTDQEILLAYTHVAKEHYDTVEKLVSKLYVARGIMNRLRRETK